MALVEWCLKFSSWAATQMDLGSSLDNRGEGDSDRTIGSSIFSAVYAVMPIRAVVVAQAVEQ